MAHLVSRLISAALVIMTRIVVTTAATIVEGVQHERMEQSSFGIESLMLGL
jgi:hypothetical protein